MFLKKIIYITMTIAFLILVILVHGAFVLPLCIALILLFNETDFLYRENSNYNETDLSQLFHKDAGPIEICRDREKAIIFVHGFPSCPQTYKYAARSAEQAGFDVYAPLLPGFGTNMENFLHTNFTQWFSYLENYYLDKRKTYKKVYVVGLSMGGALTLKLGEKYSGTEQAPDGISTTAAPVCLNSLRHGMIKSWLLYFIRSISWFNKFIDNKSERWKEMEDNHSEWMGYRGTFPHQGYSIKMAVEKIRADLKKITVPLIAFHVPGDRTVDYKNLSFIENGISSQTKQFHTVDYAGYYNTSHCLFLYESIREKLMIDILDFFESLES